MGQNETKRHFDLRNLDKDMRDAHKKASRVISKREARVISNANAVMVGVVFALVGFLLFLFGVF